MIYSLHMHMTDNKKKVVLVVEDDNLQNQRVKNILENENYNVISALNGMDGIRKSIQYKPNLILLDILLPDILGIEVMQKIRNNSATLHIPVIFCSSEVDFQLKNPNIAFITKPYSKQELLDYVQRFI